MYGQGNFTFRLGPSTPLPPYPQASPAPMAPSHQAPPGPPPPPMVHQGLPHPPPHQAPTGPLPMAYQHSPLAPPQPAHLPTSLPVNMGQYHLNSPQIIHGRASIVPTFPHIGSSYPSPMPNQNVQYSMQPMSSPRVLPLPPLASSQGQILCRPQLPPPGIQHLSTTPPPPPPNFVPINPSNLISFSQNPVGDAHASSHFLPPPPPPPSSPPPLPTSPPPPPPSSPKANALSIVSEGLPKASPEKPVECDDGDGLLESATLTDAMLAQRRSPHAGLGDYRKNVYLVEREAVSKNEMKLSLPEGEASRSFPSIPPKPTDTETVKIIEVLCQFIAKVGPSFEIEAREKEAKNPRFSFLFGGVPGSAAAIGHEYFQWMKRKYCPKASDEQVSAVHSDNSLNEEAILPADSDMDMEDDVSLPDRDLTTDQLNGASARESASVCSVVPILSSHAPECTREQLKQDIAMPNNLLCSGTSMLLQVDRDEDNSLVIEDLSPDSVSPHTTGCSLDENLLASVKPMAGDSNQVVIISHAAAVGKMEEVQRIHTKDGSPFRLIQGYASEESSEEDERDHPEDVTLTRVGSTAAVGVSDSHQVVPKECGYGENSPQKFSSHGVACKSSTVMKSSITQGFTQQDGKNAPGRTGFIYPSHKNDNNEGDSVASKANSASVDRKPNSAKVSKKDDFPLEVDEFGRLARKKGESDTDSDGEQYRKICGKRGRNQWRSRSPQENRWRQRSCSPRRDNRRRSRRSRSKSPSIRQSGAAYRLEKAQPPECFNYIKGRCFRGASCRFLHSDFVPNRSRQQEFEDISQEPGNFNVLNDGSYSESSKQTKIPLTGSDADKCDNGPGEEAKSAGMQSCQEHSLARMKSIRDGAMGDKIGWSLVTDDKPWSSCVTEQNSHETHAVRELQESNSNSIEEAKRIQPAVQSSQPQKNDCLPIQSSPACKSLSLSDETPEPDTGDVRASHQSQATSSGNKTEDPQNAPHFSPEDRHLSYHAPVQSIQPTTSQDQRPDALAYMIHPPLSLPYSSPVGQPHPSHVPANQPSIQSQLPKDFASSCFATSSVPLPSHQLLSAPTGHPSLLHSNNPSAPFATQHRENLIPPTASSDSHPGPKDMLTSFRPPMTNDYHPHNVPLNSAWSNVTPLPPSHVHGLPPRPSLPAEGYSSQKQPHIVPPLHEHSVPSRVPPGEATYPQGTDHHQSFHSARSSRHLPLIDEVRGRPSTVGQQQNQPLNREEHSSHPGGPQVSLDSQMDYHIGHHSFPPEDRGTFSGLGFTSSSSVPQVNIMQPQARPLFGDHAPPPVFSREEFINPGRNSVYSHYQANENHPSSADFHSKVDPSFQSFPSVFQEKTLSPHLPDLSIPRISRPTHYNPFASTFEQSYSSLKIASDVSMQERDTSYKTRYDLSSSSGHFPAGELGSRLTALGDSFVHTYKREMSAEVLPSVQKQFVRDPAAGDPYDPLSDSIEPSSNMFKMSDHVQEQNSVVNKLSSLHRVADVEENSRQNVGLAAMPKLDVDELGEVATDAEGGVVENGSPQPGYVKDWSPGFPIDAQNTAPGEIEIDQIQSPGKSQNKDSRSMKLFKFVLADFVKEVLKPSWRQGNMSKEAFKTIVKKTVDKVSGAMASHQIPKSQAKINHYIESSRKKLTKLVMGYVQKYVKT